MPLPPLQGFKILANKTDDPRNENREKIENSFSLFFCFVSFATRGATEMFAKLLLHSCCLKTSK